MCGKFTQMATWKEVVAFSQPLVEMPRDPDVTFTTPMRMARVMRLGEDGGPELADMRWGFSEPGDIRPKHMHARSETIDRRPRFMEAFSERRGVLVVETFNEGEELPSGKTKQWVIWDKRRLPIAIAVIWEEGEDGLPCFVMATTPPNALIARITDRMPAILLQKDWPTWLGQTDASDEEVKALLQTFDDDGHWEMGEQDKVRPTKSAARPKKAASSQGDLF